MSVQLNLLGTGRLRETRSGKSDQVEALVDVTTRDPYAARTEALEHPQIPRLGTPHPVDPSLTVAEREVAAVPGTALRMRVTVRYEQPDPATAGRNPDARYGPTQWSGSIRTYTEETIYDYRGTLMRVRYQGVPQFNIISTNTGEAFVGSTGVGTQASKTTKGVVDRTLLQLVGRRWERDNPEPRLRDLQTVTNLAPWRGYAAETVLLEGAFFNSDPAGGYQVEYQFTYNRRTWRLEDRITINGAIPLDITPGNGIARHQIYRPVNFAKLELDG